MIPHASYFFLDSTPLLVSSTEKAPSRAAPYLVGVDVQDSLCAIRALAASLLCQEAHRCTLVQESKLARGALLICWVPVDAAIEHGPVEVAHKTANVASGVRLGVGRL
jgi:hypothetical protein